MGPTPTLTLNLLGYPHLALSDGTPIRPLGSKALALLTYLTVQPPRPHSREELAVLFWPEASRSDGLTSLRQTLRSLRQSLPPTPPPLLIDRKQVSLNPDAEIWLDVSVFHQLFAACHAHTHRRLDACADCSQRLQEAITLYQGDFLVGFSLPDSDAFQTWQMAQQETLRGQTLAALTALSAFHARRQTYPQAITHLQRALELAPWQEESHRQLMRVLALDGQRSAALAQYDICVRLLAENLNVMPAPETSALRQRIEDGLLDPEELEAGNPYLGLAAFDETNAADFYGRGRLGQRLLDAVGTQPVTAVVGASGSGKSSLLHAGLLPVLRRSGSAASTSALQIPGGDGTCWMIVDFQPGSDPFLALADALSPLFASPQDPALLAAALRRGEHSLDSLAADLSVGTTPPPCHLLIAIDAFEELFTLCSDPLIRQDFLNFLLPGFDEPTAGDDESPVSVDTIPDPQSPIPFTLLLLLRADFVAQAIAYRPLADAIQIGPIVVGPLNSDELRLAVEQPALSRGVRFEPGLVDRLLADVGTDPGNLPLLQFCLTQLWGRQRAGMLTHVAYDDLGGLAGALSRYADRVFAQLEPDEQLLIRQTLRRLVQPGEGTDDTRRWVSRQALGQGEWLLVQQLADARLVVTDRSAHGEELVTLAHEALIQHWERLQGWLEEDRAFYLWQHRLGPWLRHWEVNGQDASALLRGPLLAEAESWSAEQANNLSAQESSFIETSVNQRRSEAHREEERKGRELAQVQALAEAEHNRAEDVVRTGRRLRLLASGLLLLFFLAASAGIVALRQSSLAEERRLQAVAAQGLAESHALLAQARQLSAQAVQIIDDQVQVGLLLSLESLHRSQERPDVLRLFTGLTVDPLLETTLHTGEAGGIAQLALGTDGTLLQSGDYAGRLRTWRDTPAGIRQSNAVTLSTPGFNNLVLSPTGQRIAALVNDTITLFDGPSQQVVRILANRAEGELQFMRFSADGTQLIASYSSGTLLVWDAQTGRPVGEPIGIAVGDTFCAVSPDGSTAGMVNTDEGQPRVLLRSLPDYQAVGAPQPGHVDSIQQCVFSPDGRILATAGFDGTVRLWDTTTGEPLLSPLQAHEGRVLSLAFSSDGQLLASGGSDGKIALWDVVNGELWAPLLVGHENWVLSLAFSADNHLFSGDGGGDILVWDLNRRRLLKGHTARVRSVALHPRGNQLITSSFDRTLVVWDAESGETLQTISTEHANSIIQIGFSPDGKTLASLDAGGYVILWSNPDTAHAGWRPRSAPLAAHAGVLIGLAFSADSKRMATGDFGGVVHLWDLERGELQPGSLQASADGWALSLAFSPDGRILASGTLDGSITLWSVPDLAPMGPPLQGHTNWVTTLLFEPDGQTLLSASNDQTIRRWAIPSGTALGPPLEGHRAQVWGLALAVQQGRQLLVSLGGDGSLLWWDWADQTPMGPILHTRAESESMAVSADGSRVYLGSFDETAQIWQVDLSPWAEKACRMANRNLTEDEWESYLPDEAYRQTCP